MPSLQATEARLCSKAPSVRSSETHVRNGGVMSANGRTGMVRWATPFWYSMKPLLILAGSISWNMRTCRDCRQSLPTMHAFVMPP